MEELIIDYINTYCEVTSITTVSFNGNRIFHASLKKHIIELFDVESSVDNILKNCFELKNNNFHYFLFTEEKRPSIPSGQLFYLDYSYEAVRIPDGGYNTNRRFVAGVDLATYIPDNESPIVTVFSSIARQTFNLDLTPLDNDLEE